MSFTSRDGSTVVECGYDYQGRRYMKKVTVNGTVASHERYLYRGYLQLAALDMLDNRNVLRTLLWDPLEPVATRPLALVQDASLYCYGWDFNKNVTEVFDREGAVAATYDYSPYGIVGSTGNLAQPVQWSSEMNDEELVLVYYNYRYYNPADGRWINRDPIAEEGGINIYNFLCNNIIAQFDRLGLEAECSEQNLKKHKDLAFSIVLYTLARNSITIQDPEGAIKSAFQDSIKNKASDKIKKHIKLLKMLDRACSSVNKFKKAFNIFTEIGTSAGMTIDYIEISISAKFCKCEIKNDKKEYKWAESKGSATSNKDLMIRLLNRVEISEQFPEVLKDTMEKSVNDLLRNAKIVLKK